MNKLFHRGYFKEIFRQLKTAGIVGACFLLLANVTVVIELINQRAADFSHYNIPEGYMLATPFMAFIYIMGVILTFAAFGWLNKRSTSDFYHSIPITRKAVYCSSLLAVFIWLMIGIAVFAASTVIIYIVMGAPFNFFLYACVLADMVIAALEVIGAAAIGCAISGTRFVDLIATAVILFIPRFLFTVLGVFVWRYGHQSLVVPTISPLFDPSFNIIATPYAAMMRAMGWSEFATDFANGWAMLYNLVYSLLLIFLGGAAFNKRKSEHAGMATTKGIFQHIIRTAVGLPFLLIMVFIMMDDGEFNMGSIVLLILAFVAYCLFELISTKSAKRMLNAMPLFVICLGISFLFLVLPELISKIELAKRADADNIKGFTIVQEPMNYYFGDFFDGFDGESDDYVITMQNRVVLDDPDAIRIIANAYNFTSSREHSNGNDVAVKICRKGMGGRITRRLTLSEVDYVKLMSIWNDSEECRSIEKTLPDGKNWYIAGPFTRSENAELGKLFKEEYEALDHSDKEAIRNYYYMETGSISIIGYKGADNYSQQYRLTDKTPKTTAKYYELLNRNNADRFKLTLEKVIKWMETEEDEPFFNISAYDPRGNGESPEMIHISNYGTHYYNSGSLPMQTDPELYELLKSFASAEQSTDPSNAYLIEIFCDDYGMGNANRECRVAVKLTEEQLELIENVNEHYGYSY